MVGTRRKWIGLCLVLPMLSPASAMAQIDGYAANRHAQQGEAGPIEATPEKAFATSIDGRIYEGRLKARARPAGGRSTVRHGRASIRLVPQGTGRATLHVTGAIDGDEASASFWSEGRIVAGGWATSGGTIDLRIAPDGRIRGSATDGSRQMTFSGTATPTRIRLVTDLVLREPSRPGQPAGSRFRFTYDVSRSLPKLAEPDGGKAPSATKSKRCKKIRYEMRPTPSFDGGAMGMVRVPVCLNE